MILFFLCLTSTTQPASCQRSFLGLLRAPLIWMHRSGPMPSCAAAPTPSPSELGPGTRLSPSAGSSPDTDAEPGSQRRHAPPPGAGTVDKPAIVCRSSPPTTRLVSFSDPPASTPSRQRWNSKNDRSMFEPCLRFSRFQRRLFLCIPAQTRDYNTIRQRWAFR